MMITTAALPTERVHNQVASHRANPSYRIARALLVPLGPQAETVAQTVLALSQRWLDTPPPLQILSATALLAHGVDSIEAQRTLYAAADGLADQALFATLRRAGYSLKDEDELAIWLLLDTPSPDSSPVGDLPAPAEAIALYHAVATAIRQRLHMQAVGHAMLLAEPAAQDLLSPWVTALRQAELQAVYTAGPINCRHLRLSVEAWSERAATALMTLLWSTFPSHGHGDEPTLLYAIGAAHWIAPRAAIKQCLATQTASAFVQQCLAHTASHRAEQPPLADPEQLFHVLSRTVPQPLSLRLPRRPSWPTLNGLATHLTTMADQHTMRRGLAQHQSRQRWLANQLDAWRDWFGQLTDGQLVLKPGESSLLQERQTLCTWQQALLRTAALVDQQLEQLGEQLLAAERRVQRTRQQLEALCAELPPPALSPLGLALLQPWRWLSWLWTYGALLPPAQQRLCDALGERARLTWLEANWHAVRQLYLAMLQDLQHAIGQRDRLIAQLQTCAQILSEQQRTNAEAAAPWSPAGLTRLWRQLCPADLDERFAVFCRDQPLDTWTQLEPAALATALTQVVAPAFAFVDQWSALECLILAFQLESTASGNPDDSGLKGLNHRPVPATADLDTTHQFLTWLDDHFDQAAPLWPSQPEVATQDGSDWLLVADYDLPYRLQSLMTRASNPLTTWAAHKHTLSWAQSPTVGIAFLRIQPLVFEHQDSDIPSREHALER
jgi:hypothetical protein